MEMNTMDIFAAVIIGGTVIFVISIFGLTFRKLVRPEITVRYKDINLRIGESKDPEND
jgi:hypothetical protein